ncbi:hypothetical protein D3C78_1641480 [compost metagenome]
MGVICEQEGTVIVGVKAVKFVPGFTFKSTDLLATSIIAGDACCGTEKLNILARSSLFCVYLAIKRSPE